MNRITKPSDNSEGFVIDNDKIISGSIGYTGEAVEKLARFENMIEAIIADQVTISKQLEALWNENKTGSYKFKELMGKKLTNSAVLATLGDYGFEVK